MVDQNEITIKVQTYNDKSYEIKISTDQTFKEIKNILAELDEELADVKFIYGGRLIRNDEAKISQYTTDNGSVFYVNQAQVHGGCCPKTY